MADFKIKSTELRDYNKWHDATIVQNYDDNKVIIKLEPAIPSYVYGSEKDINKLIISPKYKGDTLLPVISSFPMNVHIIQENQDKLHILDWGVIDKIN